MKTINATESLFDQLRELFSMEVQVAMSLPVLSGSVMNIRLRKLLAERALLARERRDQVAFFLERYGEAAGTVVCSVSKGILSGGNNILAGVKNPFMRDWVMAGHCLRIEHHEIAAYGVSASLAERSGYTAEALCLAALQSELEVARPRLQSLEAELFRIASSHPSCRGLMKKPQQHHQIPAMRHRTIPSSGSLGHHRRYQEVLEDSPRPARDWLSVNSAPNNRMMLE